MLSPRLHNFLDERHAPYTTLTHDRTITAHETAAAAHIGNQHFAKTVMLKVDGKLAMMVMPAAYRVDLTRLSRALGGRDGRTRQEAEFKDAFPDCELGAMPPFGHLYGMPVYVDSRLAATAGDRVQRRLAHRRGAHAVRRVRAAGAAGAAVAGACDVSAVVAILRERRESLMRSR